MLLKSLKFASLPLVVLSLVFVLAGTEDAAVESAPSVTWEGSQPIAFNHALHTQEWELDCDVCHRYVLEAEFAGRPKLEVCAACHEDPMTEGAEEARLVEYIQSGREIPWRRLYRVPSHVYYSHRRHVAVAKLDCVECHGEIGTTTLPPEKPLNKLTMKFCINCHEDQGVTTDCNACHR